ncbi:MAG TPA: cbb3-type cytochrome c oxidase N-terminal domain-containing protein [Chitinophagales bacterium]|nr:cbb3-type cytochrome c oxidase N-terminal domain-containing protein [Chitinophagales bacterium]
MINPSIKKILTGAALLTGAVAGAQETPLATTATSSAAEPSNGLLYLIVAACAILLIAVLLLGQVLVKVTGLAIDKRSAKVVATLLLVFGINTLWAQDAAAKPFQMPISMDLLVGTVVLTLELIVVIWMLLRIKSLLQEIAGEKKKEFTFNYHLPRFFDNINASVAIEKEQDILLDHNYDGIRELDNSLPPWWKYSFYISIIWSILYLGYYYIGGGPSSTDEYIAEVQQAKIEVEAFNKKNALNVDENNVTLANAAGIIDGMDIYKNNCAACHGNAGEGNVGPNLTDEYWLHGGSVSEVFKSVKYGWPAKGMKSWQSDLSPVQMKNVVSYIHSIKGSNPANAKAPQGDLYNEAGTAASDSTKIIDSAMVAAADTTKK